MADRLPYFKLYPADFMGSGKVQMMTPAELGIYFALLCYSWQEGPLPDDHARLWRVCGAAPEEMERAWPAVRKCFELTPDGLVNPRLERERASAMDRREKARAAANARYHADAPADAYAPAPADAPADDGAPGGARAVPYPESQRSQSTQRATAERSQASEAPPEGAPSAGTKREGWVTRAGEIWREVLGGEPSFGNIGRHLKPLIETQGEPEVLETWGTYLADENPKYASPATFAQKYGAIRDGTWSNPRASRSANGRQRKERCVTPEVYIEPAQ